MENEETLSLEEAASAYAPSILEESQEDHTEETDDTEELEPVEDTTEDGVEDEEGEQDDDQDPQEEVEEDDSYEPVNDYAIEVKMPDGTTATLQDLINGNEGRADITRKQQAIAEENRQIADQREVLEQNQQQLQQRNEMLAQYLHQSLPPPPTPELAQTDLVAYTQQKALYDDQVAKFRQFEQEWQQGVLENEQAQANKREENRQALYRDLFTRRPELNDPVKYQAYEAELVQAFEAFGGDAKMIQFIDHPAYLKMAEAAINYTKIQSKTKKPAKKGKRPPVIRGSKSKSAQSGKLKQQRVAMNRLSKSGHLDDGVAALLALEKD